MNGKKNILGHFSLKILGCFVFKGENARSLFINNAH